MEIFIEKLHGCHAILFKLVVKLSGGIKEQIELVMSIAFNYWLHRNLLIKFVSRWQQNDHNQFPKEHNQPVFTQNRKYILQSFLLTTALTEIPLDETTWEARTICLSPTVAIVAIFSKCPINKWTAEILSWKWEDWVNECQRKTSILAFDTWQCTLQFTWQQKIKCLEMLTPGSALQNRCTFCWWNMHLILNSRLFHCLNNEKNLKIKELEMIYVRILDENKSEFTYVHLFQSI